MSESQSTSDYPGALDTWETITDKEDLAEVVDINKIKAALLAIQTELGVNPAGSLTDLVARLAIMMEDNGSMNQGTSFPGSPVEGQVFYRTDTDTVYIYDGSTWDTMATPAMSVVSVTSWAAATSSGNIALSASKIYKLVFRLTIDGTTDSAINLDISGTGDSWDYDIKGTAASGQANVPLGTVEASSDHLRYMHGELSITTFASGNTRAIVTGTYFYFNTSSVAVANYIGARFYSTAAIGNLTLGSAQNMTGTVYLYELGTSV